MVAPIAVESLTGFAGEAGWLVNSRRGALTLGRTTPSGRAVLSEFAEFFGHLPPDVSGRSAGLLLLADLNGQGTRLAWGASALRLLPDNGVHGEAVIQREDRRASAALRGRIFPASAADGTPMLAITSRFAGRSLDWPGPVLCLRLVAELQPEHGTAARPQ